MWKPRFIIVYLACLSLVIASPENCYHKQKKAKGKCMTHMKCSWAFQDYINGIAWQKCSKQSEICCVKTGQKSIEMCGKYKELGFEMQSDGTLIAIDELLPTSICPYEDNGQTVIYGGEEAKFGEFPHMALLGYGQDDIEWGCGGSLISDKFVLTAAHCLSHRTYGKVSMVRLGELDYNDPNDDEYLQEIPVVKHYKHEGYKFPATYNDIAVIELEHPAELSIFVKPICIYTEERIPSTQVLAVGWGDTEKRDNGMNSMLMKVALDIIDRGNCSRTFGKELKLPRGLDVYTQMCAGSTEQEKDTCVGDSGGPIQIRNMDVECSYYIVGITSYGKKGCGMKVPAVYTRIFPYIQWIEDIIY